MKSKMKGVLVTVVLGGVLSIASAQEQQSEELEQGLGLIIPEDLSYNPNNVEGFEYYEEYRVGGRLERVTVKRDGGLTEIYKNNRNDALWDGAENDLGEVRNQRQWKIGSW